MLHHELESRVVLGDVDAAEVGVELEHGCHQAPIIGFRVSMVFGPDRRTAQ
jgi:hypothetical protein